MLLCSINDIRPGMVLGALVTDPKSPDLRLLLPGVVLDASVIRSMAARGVTQAWVEDDLTKDLDGAVAAELIGARTEVYTRLRDDLAALSKRTLTTASVHSYKQAVMGLVTEAISSAPYVGLTDSLFAADGLATHGANVAYLALLCGLHAEQYLIAEQPRLEREHARDMTVLGLAGMLHDIGKTRLPAKLRGHHAVHGLDGVAPEGYEQHITIGRTLLEHANAPARVAHTVLNHHQRFDGQGWPDMTELSAGRHRGPLAGKRIHISARIVSAANVLDNLLRDAEGARRPPVAALSEFASSRFDGWFDPVIRRAMLMRVPPFSIGCDLKLNDGRRAVVVAPSTGDRCEPCRPIVRVLTDPAGTRVADGETIDLESAPSLSITHAMGEDVVKYLYAAPAEATVTPAEDTQPV